MKVRLGFVSNSSSTCFMCGDWISEGDKICDECLMKQVHKEGNTFARWICDVKDLDYDDLYKRFIRSRKAALEERVPDDYDMPGDDT